MYLALHEFIHWIKDRINDWGNDGKKSFLSRRGVARELKRKVGDKQASWLLWHLSPSPDSACVETSLQWGLTFIYCYWLHRILKPTFPLRLNKVLVLHFSEKAASGCLSLELEQRPYYYFPWKTRIVYVGLPPLNPCYSNITNAMYLTHFLLGCALFWFILKWWWKCWNFAENSASHSLSETSLCWKYAHSILWNLKDPINGWP